MSGGAIMNRRRFITGMAGILAAGYSASILPSGVIMPVRKVWVPDVPSGMAMMMDVATSRRGVVFHDGYFFASNPHGVILSARINDPGYWGIETGDATA